MRYRKLDLAAEKLGFNKIDLNKQLTDVLIVANGEKFDKFALYIKSNKGKKTVIALDGAYDNFLAHEIVPDLLIGDFDSISSESKRGLGIDNKDGYLLETALGLKVLPCYSQNFTDLDKAVILAVKHGATNIEIINFLGNRLDHSFSVLGLLKNRFYPDVKIIARDELQSLFYAEGPCEVKLNLEVGSYIGIVGAPRGKILKSSGLIWEISEESGWKDGYNMGFMRGSTCNRVKNHNVKISLDGEVLIMYTNKNSLKKAKN